MSETKKPDDVLKIDLVEIVRSSIEEALREHLDDNATVTRSEVEGAVAAWLAKAPADADPEIAKPGDVPGEGDP